MSGKIVLAAVTPAASEWQPSATPQGQAISEAIGRVGRALVEAGPEAIVYLVQPEALRKRAMGMCAAPLLQAAWGPEGMRLHDVARTDFALQQLVAMHVQEAGLHLALLDRYHETSLHLSAVMLRQCFAKAGLEDLPVLVLALADRTTAYHQNFGHAFVRAVQHSGRRVAVVAAVDVPAADTPVAAAFADRWLAEGLPSVGEGAGEAADAARALAFLAGSLSEYAVTPHRLADGPGAGHLVALARPQALTDAAAPERPVRPAQNLGQLALEALYCYATRADVLRAGGDVAARYAGRRAGAMIQLYRHGQVLCESGTVVPSQGDLCDEVVHNAVAVAEQLGPVMAEDWPLLTARVCVVGELEPLGRLDGLDPHRHGLLITTGLRTAVTLPDFTGQSTAERQMAATKAKLGLLPAEPAWTYRFDVETAASWEVPPPGTPDGEASLPPA